MKSSYYMIVIGLLVLQFYACAPSDNTDPNDPVAKFLGTWKVTESCSRMNYDVDIQQDPGNSAQVLISNFGNPGAGYDPAVGLVVSNTVTVSSQTIGTGWTVSGNGTYHSDGTIAWNYTLIVPPNNYSCSATFSK
jgi:hypothetical protein